LGTQPEAPHKIGLFGGTFNPVHIGHLRPCEEIREIFGLSSVIFIPAAMPPHKSRQIIPARHRFEMVKRAINDNPFFELSDVELRREGSSYSYETIDYFSARYDRAAELYFIMGRDAFRDMHTWKNYPDIFSLCNFIIMNRPVADDAGRQQTIPPDIADLFSPQEEGLYRHCSGRLLCFCEVSLIEVSSTDVRRRIEEGKTIRYIVPEGVSGYITQHNLFSP
jgi:nicotinate-nucleotide adenylyltransferase